MRRFALVKQYLNAALILSYLYSPSTECLVVLEACLGLAYFLLRNVLRYKVI